jgi:hypothetical protein
MAYVAAVIQLIIGMHEQKMTQERVKKLEAFKLSKTDMMGFTISEQYFLNLDKAKEKFDEKIEEYRKNEYLASKEEAREHNICSDSIAIKENRRNIKSAMVCLWYQCSYEYDEWDITVEHLELEKIEIA